MLHESHAPAAVLVPGVVIAPGAVALETQHGWSRRPKMTRDPAFARAHLPPRNAPPIVTVSSSEEIKVSGIRRHTTTVDVETTARHGRDGCG